MLEESGPKSKVFDTDANWNSLTFSRTQIIQWYTTGLFDIMCGSDGARTLMYDTIGVSTNSRRSTIRCFRAVRRTKTISEGVTADLSPEYPKNSGQKLKNVTPGARVCDS